MAMKPFMTTKWTHLAMLNYEVDPAILRPLVPRGTELDDFSGRYLASIVGFLFRETRLWGIALPGYRAFPEVNLRFYVRSRSREGWRRGVVFVKEIVPMRAVAWTARRFYGENFFTHPMSYQIDFDIDDPCLPMRVEYAWRTSPDWHRIEVHTEGTPTVPDHGSEAEFITEHYWGYTARRDGTTSEYRVEHPPWKVSTAVGTTFDCDATGVYGAAWASFLSGEPHSAFLAEGSQVTVYRSRKLALAGAGRDGIKAVSHA